MTLPITGSWRVRLHQAKPYSIHGDSYFELVVERAEEPGKLLGIRTSGHAVAADVGIGDEVEIAFLMGQVTGVKKVASR